MVRHGETESNRIERLQGQTDDALSALGVAQAEAVAGRLAGMAFGALYSSDLGRALRTAEAIAQRCGVPAQALPELRERHFGVFQGRTWDEIHREFPAEYEAYWRGPDYAPPGGETRAQRDARVLGCTQRLADQHAGERIVLVTHGGPLEALFKHAVGLPPDSTRRFSLYNASLALFRIDAGRWQLLTWGDVTHLPHSSTPEKF